MPLTCQADWEKEGFGRPLTQARSDFQSQLDELLPKRDDWSALEIGACPGAQLLALALSHGYRPAALDYLPAVRELPGIFARHGVGDLEVFESDFLDFTTSRRFNVVMSFGFIEHFTDPGSVIGRHWDLVEDGGYMVLGTPVFGPLQWALRRLVLKPDRLAQVLMTHNREIMDPRAIAAVCRRLPGARVESASYAGRMDSWFRPSDRDVRRGRAWLVVLWLALARIPRWLNWSSRLFSPLGLVVTRKTASENGTAGSGVRPR